MDIPSSESWFSDKSVVVTGGTGFVGFALTRRLAGLAREVRVLALADDPHAGRLRGLGPAVRLMTGDIRQRETLPPVFAGADVVFHCAALVTDWAPRRYFEEVNVRGAQNAVAAAADTGVERFVHVSTNDVFGLREGVEMDETFPLEPWGEPYPDTKIEAERALWRAHAEGRVDVSMVYPCWVYGPGDRSFVPELARAIASRQMVLWRRDCLVWPNFVENLVDLLILVAARPEASGQGYLAHDGVGVTLDEFCVRIAEAIGAPRPRLVIPKGAALAIAEAMERVFRLLHVRSRPLLTTYIVKNLGSRLEWSTTKARRELDWQPRIDFEAGFEETIAWMRAEGIV